MWVVCVLCCVVWCVRFVHVTDVCACVCSIETGDEGPIPNARQVRKRHFLSHLYIKVIILPRQARDKHRETSKKDAVFSQWLCEDQTDEVNTAAHP
jgi:hypothetical protein